MRRREFVTLLGGAAVTWPLPLRAPACTRLHFVNLSTGKLLGEE
jgi:hypothetical protein